MDIATHKCFIQRVNKKDDEPRRVYGAKLKNRLQYHAGNINDVDEFQDPPLMIYADYEAVVDEDGVHSPILICAEREDDDDTQVFYSPDCSEEFLIYLDEQCTNEYEEEHDVIVIFHNLKGYDGMFILQQLYKEHRTVQDQICIGTKVLSLKSGNLKFIDSLCFLPFPLAAFPQTFGISELKKGFFPHLFNTLENQDYIGPIPSAETYDPEGMSKKKMLEFNQWYAEQLEDPNRLFNLQEEMIDYCISDVKLLKAGCLKFQEEFKEKGDFNPMEKCVTVTSACNRYWRKMHLTPQTIAVEPPTGWHGSTGNQSLKASKWLYWCEHQLRSSSPRDDTQPDRIAHSRNGGEHSILTPARVMHVDGYDATTQTVYEFHGCLWHGCPSCYPDRHQASKVNLDRTMREMYQATKAKTNLLRNMGYTVVEQWECDFDLQIKHNPELSAYLDSLEVVEPLKPRDAFFGGRTGAASLYYKVDRSKGEEIRYVDVTSEYPWTNKYGTHPVGHPTIITNPEDQNITNYYGIAKIDVLPPYNLFHPVLPNRYNGKLTFPLCKTCVHEEQQKPMLDRTHHCHHTEEQRTMRGTWCTPEILKAVEKGYQVVKIHEVWHFPEEQRKTGLFASYVNTWLKEKQEASGWPSWVQSDEDKERYVRAYEEREGIKLNAEQIRKNPGRKATAKLMLNSFWGKFGERLNKPQVESVTTPAMLFQYTSDPLLDIKAIRICNDNTLEIVFTSVTENAPLGTKTNIFIAAFTTSQARLKLYESLEKVNESVLYYDTDSVIHKWKPGDPEIELGDYLGDMTNELDEGDSISSSFSVGIP